MFNQSSDGAVRVINRCGVNGCLIGDFPVLANDLVWSGKRCMWFMKPHIEKEWCGICAFLFEPCNRFIDNQLARVSFEVANSFTIAPKVGRIPMGRRSIQIGCKPIVKSVLINPGLISATKRRSQVPLPDMCRFVAILF